MRGFHAPAHDVHGLGGTIERIRLEGNVHTLATGEVLVGLFHRPKKEKPRHCAWPGLQSSEMSRRGKPAEG